MHPMAQTKSDFLSGNLGAGISCSITFLLFCLALIGAIPNAQAATVMFAPDGVIQTSGNSNAVRTPTNLFGDASSTNYVTPGGAADGWHTASGTTATFVFSFDKAWTITLFHLWNYNHATTWTLGVKNYKLETSPDDTGETFTTRGSFTARGVANNSSVETVTLQASGVRRVRWTITSNYGYTNVVGASEIAFTGSPFFPDLGTGWKLPAKREDFHIFLLMGQSNMAGYGTLLAGDTNPVPGVVVLDGQSNIGSSTPANTIQWRKGSHRLHVLQTTGRFGLGMDFAKQYLADHPGVLVGLIPCAWGGAAISSLNKGTGTYINATNRAAQAVDFGVIKGVLWHQGESDSVNATVANAYQEKLHQFIQDLRADLQSPDLPFVAGELGQFYYPNRSAAQQPYIIIVQNILGSLPTFDSRTACVKTEGLDDGGDNVHFNRDSLIILGQRYAAALLEVQKRNQAEVIFTPSSVDGQKLEWLPTLGRTYTIKFNPDLSTTNWTPLATGRTKDFIDTAPARTEASKGFYRMEAEN